MHKRILTLLFLVIPYLLFSGGIQEPDEAVLSSVETEPAFTIQITDSAGKILTLNKPVSRLISLGPNITETVFALGRGELLVGRTDWCDFPPEVVELPGVGDIQGPSTETILSLAPDLVIASSHAPMEELKHLDNAGINTAIFYGPEDFTGAFDVIRGTAALLDARDEGDIIINDMVDRAGQIEENVALLDSRPSVYYVVGFGEGGDWTAGGDTFIHQIITMAGGDNVAGDMTGWSYSLEELVLKDPEIIIIAEGLKDSFSQTPVYSELTAVKDEHVYEVDQNVIVRQGPRLIDGLETLYNLFSLMQD